MKTVVKYLSLLLLLTSCEKEIDLDYHEVAPLYAAEATVTPDGTNVWVRTTQSVTDNSASGHGVTNATIQLYEELESGELFPVASLTHRRDGHYTSTFAGIPSLTYVIDIEIDGEHYTSKSTMPNAPVVNSFRFVWKKMLSELMLFADLRIQDEQDKVNYYFMHLYRNNVGYRWAIMDDRANPGAELQQLFSCTTKRQMDEGTDSDVLRNGDQLRMEVRSIDRRAYDYLYSLQLMDNSGTNPIANFSGGLLGYFSAFQQVTLQMPFHQDSIRTAAASGTRR